jgi:hypothetical protein
MMDDQDDKQLQVVIILYWKREVACTETWINSTINKYAAKMRAKAFKSIS